MRPSFLSSAVLSLALLAACHGKDDTQSALCGLSALTGPLAAQQALGQGAALAEAPWNPPARIPIRIVGGGLFQGSVAEVKTAVAGRTDWVVTMTDSLPAGGRTGHGVLVVDTRGNNHGILLFDGPPVARAAIIGRIATRDTVLQLIGVRMSAGAIEDSHCPLFGTATR